MEHIIKYYPVGNADCTLIKLDNGKTILVVTGGCRYQFSKTRL